MPAQPTNAQFSNPSSASESARPSSRLVAAVLANVEDGFGQELSRSEFRELVAARGRSCDAALLELRRAASERGTAVAGSGERTPWGRSITGLRTVPEAIIRLERLEADNARLRRLVGDQRAEIERLERLSRPPRG